MKDDNEVFVLLLLVIPLVIMAIAFTYIFLFHGQESLQDKVKHPQVTVTKSRAK